MSHNKNRAVAICSARRGDQAAVWLGPKKGAFRNGVMGA